MNRGLLFLGGLGLGAGLMYLLDPAMGRRRRSMLRDQAVGAANQLQEGLESTWRDVQHRAQGLASEVSDWASRERVSDRVLTERVRSKMGHYISHPSSIHVTAHDGQVTLSGPILANEVGRLLAAVHSVRGVRGVDNQLDVHEERGNVSALQGGRERTGEQWEVMQRNWSPTTRLVAGAVGATLLGVGFTREFPTACVLGTLGSVLLLRAATNQRLMSLVGLGTERHCRSDRSQSHPQGNGRERELTEMWEM